MDEHAVARLGDPQIAKIFVGVQTSADDVYFIALDRARVSDSLIEFEDKDGRSWQIERAITRPALRDRSLLPFERDPVPDALAVFPYRIESTSTGRMRAAVLQPLELEERYPKATKYLRGQRERLQRRQSVKPDPGHAFYAYGRSQSLSKLDSPKIIVRVLSLTPTYVTDTRGLLVPGGGDGGPYYLIRIAPECKYSMETIVAILSHPAVDAFVASHGRAYRGSYIVHRKAFLKRVPLPQLDAATASRVEANVREIQGIIERLRGESDSTIRDTLRGRHIFLLGSVRESISNAFGLDHSEVDAL